MRDYSVMRQVLAVVAEHGSKTVYGSFSGVTPISQLPSELERLMSDGLVSGSVARDRDGTFVGLEVGGLTAEGRELWRLLENPEVWRIVLDTLSRAVVDVSYPLLKEVCEEIVKRYVIQFIPSM